MDPMGPRLHLEPPVCRSPSVEKHLLRKKRWKSVVHDDSAALPDACLKFDTWQAETKVVVMKCHANTERKAWIQKACSKSALQFELIHCPESMPWGNAAHILRRQLTEILSTKMDMHRERERVLNVMFINVLRIHLHLRVWVYIADNYVYITCIYIYICTYIYTYVHVHIHIHIFFTYT